MIFVLFAKFDLSSKLSKTLQTEHIEDVAAILLAIGGLPEPTDRSRLLPILRGDEVLTSYSAASTLRQSVLDGNVREQLQQLDKHVLRCLALLPLQACSLARHLGVPRKQSVAKDDASTTSRRFWCKSWSNEGNSEANER